MFMPLFAVVVADQALIGTGSEFLYRAAFLNVGLQRTARCDR